MTLLSELPRSARRWFSERQKFMFYLGQVTEAQIELLLVPPDNIVVTAAPNTTAALEKWRLVRVHDLRRTGATWAFQRGVPLSTVAAMLGDNPEIVRRHYAHVVPSFLSDVADSVGAAME